MRLVHHFFSAITLVFLPLISIVFVQASEKISHSVSQEVIEKARLASVSIDTSISLSPFQGGSSKFSGSGFVIDKKMGIIATNAHILGGQCVAEEYLVTFHNGSKAEAKPLYCEIWQDIGFLKIDPKDLPHDTPQLEFAEANSLKEGDQVFSISNSERAAFSFNSGYLSSLHSTMGVMPQHAYVINYNQTSGSSGAAVLDTCGKIVGVNFGGGTNSGASYKLAVNGQYLEYLIGFLSKNSAPIRKHTGAILGFYSISDATTYRGFPKDLAAKYMKDRPSARGNVLEVRDLIPASPAAKVLKSGDIIWQADASLVADNFYAFDTLVNNAGTKAIKLGIYRYGVGFLDVEINTYDIEKTKISRIVDVCDARFVEADCELARYRGVPVGTLICCSILPSSPFYKGNLVSPGMEATLECGFSTLELASRPLKSMACFVKELEVLKKKGGGSFPLRAMSYIPQYIFGQFFKTSPVCVLTDIKLKPDFKFEIYDFDHKQLRWIKTTK